MYTVTQDQFCRMVGAHRRLQGASSPQQPADPILRPDQEIRLRGREHSRQMATCLRCDSVIDAAIVQSHSGLCPRCHLEWMVG